MYFKSMGTIKDAYRVIEAARFCRISVNTLHRRIKEGEIRCFHAGGGRTVLIEREEIVRFLNQHNIPLPEELATRKIKLLVVDDDEKLLRALRRFFEKTGEFEVETVSSGLAAGFQIQSVKPHLILLDIMLGDIDGRELIQILRKNPEFKNIKIIAFSGFIKEEEVSHLLKLGFDAYFSKPFELPVLMERIQTLVQH